MGDRHQGVKVMDPSGTVLIVHTPSTGPFAPWGKEENDEDDYSNNINNNKESDKQRADQGTDGRRATFKCSWDVLRLVSPMLATSLDGRWTESRPDAKGIRRIDLKEFDSEALHYVLNVLHHRHDLNPHNLTVESLAKIAVLVDYLGCHQAFVLASQVWAAGYKGVPEGEFRRPALLWLLVSTVFAMRPIFDSAATMAIRHGTGPLDKLVKRLDLPIEERVVKLVDKHRQDRIGMLVGGVYALKDKLQRGSGCTIECDSFHLGRLLIEMKKRGLDPVPCKPYRGVSISGIHQMVGEFDLIIGRGAMYTACHERRSWEDRNSCVVGTAVKRILETAQKEYKLGIKLGERRKEKEKEQ